MDAAEHPPLRSTLDRWHRRLRASALALRLVVGTRVLLAAGFLPTGLVKLLGQRFTSIPPSHPVGAFFEAMYQTGGYWRFLGGTQVLAALLLLLPATAPLGAVVFFPVILNIFVITVALDFRGTPVITGLMLLGNLLLLAWDYPRWKGLLFGEAIGGGDATAARPLSPVERATYTAGAVSGLLLFGAARSLVPAAWFPPLLGVAAASAIAAVGLGLRAALGGRRRGDAADGDRGPARGLSPRT